MSAYPGTADLLDWVTFSDGQDGGDCCQAQSEPCRLEAVARAWYQRACDHEPNPQRLCVRHCEMTVANARKYRGWFSCRTCRKRTFLVRIERLR